MSDKVHMKSRWAGRWGDKYALARFTADNWTPTRVAGYIAHKLPSSETRKLREEDITNKSIELFGEDRFNSIDYKHCTCSDCPIHGNK